ncbi:MAG TPA: hypothetical protein ENI23_06560 [bacterium]|nr:hypothetical protein [bacterium]
MIQGSEPSKEDLDRVTALRNEKLKELKLKKIGDVKELPVILDKLTEKQQAYVEARSSGMKKIQAGAIASPESKNPSNTANVIEKNPLVRRALSLAFEEAGLTPLALAYAFKKGLDAKKTYIDKHTGTLEESDLDDHKIQLESAKAVVEIQGLGVKKDEKGDSHLHIHLSREEMDDMEGGVLAHLQSKFGKKD